MSHAQERRLHAVGCISMRRLALLSSLAASLASLVTLAACNDAASKPVVVRAARVVPGTTPYTGDQNYLPDDRAASNPERAAPATATADELSEKPEGDDEAGTGEPQRPASDAQKGDKKDAEWVPAEHKTGLARWKDTGVYVDGKPVGFLSWGELPVTLKPTWIRDRVSANKRPGTKDLGWRWTQERTYTFNDYLRAIGIQPAKVKEIHVYGPRYTQSIVATGKDLMTPLGQEFRFRFGGSVSGKAIPHLPEGFANGKTPDKISSVMIYLDKKPPTLVPQQGFVLDGVLQVGVPYYGEPIRGGIRVYLDNKLAAIIKRQELDPTHATKTADGELHWKLADVLAAQGVKLDKVVELWVIRDEMRREKLPGKDVPTLEFSAGEKAKGGIELGGDRLRANAIALSTRPIADSELPVVTSDDQ